MKKSVEETAAAKEKKTRELGVGDYRTHFCDLRFLVDSAFDLMNKYKSNRAEQCEILKTIARLAQEKTVEFNKKEEPND